MLVIRTQKENIDLCKSLLTWFTYRSTAVATNQHYSKERWHGWHVLKGKVHFKTIFADSDAEYVVVT